MKSVLTILIVCLSIQFSGLSQQFVQLSQSDLSEKGIKVLIFLKEGCPICQKYIPLLKDIVKDFRGDSARFYGIFPDKSPNTQSINKYIRKYDIPFPVYIDSLLEITKFSGATITPEVVVFDSEGEIRYTGRIDDWFVSFGKKRTNPTIHNLRDALYSLIHKQPITIKKTDAVGCYIPL